MNRNLVQKIPLLSLVVMLASSAVSIQGFSQDNETREENESDADEMEEEGQGEDEDDEDDERGERDEEEESDEEDEHEEEDEEDDEERKVEVEVDQGEASIELKRERGEDENKIEMRFESDDARFELKFEAEAGDAETERKLEARFHALVEFVDGDGDGAFDAGEEAASAWSLSEDEAEEFDIDSARQATWEPLAVEDVTVDGTSGKLIRARASLGGNGTFGLDIRVFGDFVDVGNSSLEPTEAKVDVVIQDYPFVRNDTRLALFLRTEAKEELELEGDDDEEGVAAESNVSGLAVVLRFEWADNATVDNATQPVRTTVLESKDEREDEEAKEERRFALAYARGANILHDPIAGVSYATLSTDGEGAGTPGFPAGAWLLAVAVALALTLVRALRRR